MPGQSNIPSWLITPVSSNKTVNSVNVFKQVSSQWKLGEDDVTFEEETVTETIKSKYIKDPYDANGTNMDNILKYGFEEAVSVKDPFEKIIAGDTDFYLDPIEETTSPYMKIDPKNLDPYGLERQNGAWMINCDLWIQKGLSPLFYNVNPSQVTWNMPLRSAIQKTRAGLVTHVWGDRKKGKHSIFDNPSVNITWQSGSIMPIKIVQGKKTKYFVPAGINILYQMLDLLGNTQSILDNGTQNRIHITYRSLIFPKIILIGIFDPTGTTFSESADNPAGFTYDTTFHIQQSIPTLSGTAIKTSLMEYYTASSSWRKSTIKKKKKKKK